ncbi:hypothetical protein GUI43_05805 [Micromonospora noduli]|nr:hypothetical protein GUI43_05805 [Micromonospora noduli]
MGSFGAASGSIVRVVTDTLGGARRIRGRASTVLPVPSSCTGAYPASRRAPSSRPTWYCVHSTVGASRRSASDSSRRSANTSLISVSSSLRRYAPARPTRSPPCLRATSSIR